VKEGHTQETLFLLVCNACETYIGRSGIIRGNAKTDQSPCMDIRKCEKFIDGLEAIDLCQARDVTGKRFKRLWLRAQR
jgi:hypothetical protein